MPAFPVVFMVVFYGNYLIHPWILSVPFGVRGLGVFGISLIILTVHYWLYCCADYCRYWACQCATFVNGCLYSDCEVIRFVARQGVYFRRMLSPIGRNSLFFCRRFGVRLSDIGYITRSFVWACYQS